MTTARAPRMGWIGLAGIVLSAGLLVYLLLELDLEAVGRAIAAAASLPLAAATLLYSALFFLRGARWAQLLRPVAPVSNDLATRGLLVGFMANNLLPARLGDVVRAVVLARRAEVPASASFASVLLERIFDGLVVVGALAGTLSLLSLDASDHVRKLRVVAALMGCAFAGAFLVSLFLAVREAWTLRVARRLLAPFPEGLREKVLGLLGRLAAGLHSLRSLRAAARITGLSVLVWALEVAVYVLVASSLGLEVSPLGLTLVMAVLTLGLTAPSAPGFVGVFEALVIPALLLLGIPPEEGAAFALVLHAIHYVPGTLLGAGAAWTLGMRVVDLRRAPAEAPPKTEAPWPDREATSRV